MASWIVRRSGETYLEPSLGDGAFVEAVAEVTAGRGMSRPTWVAAELDADAARTAVARGVIRSDELHVSDFFELRSRPVDAVIANPPYVRLRHLDPAARLLALDSAARHLGTTMAPSGSVWMPFVLHMTSFLKLGGRMALVLPLDFTYVTYAQPLWEYLGKRFESLRVIRIRERVFPKINQDVLLLLADGHGGKTEIVDHEAYETVEDMIRGRGAVGGQVEISKVVRGERAFQSALLSRDLLEVLDLARSAHQIQRASDYVRFRIGYVAGDKRYFHPDDETIRSYDIPSGSLTPSLTNARKLRGHGLRTSSMPTEVADQLWLPDGSLTPGESRYVRRGEIDGVSVGYKAAMRTPWYRVPGVNSPDAIVTVFSERPLLVINDAGWTASNSLLCAYVEHGTIEQFAAAWYNPLTLLSIGLQVHSLGGGVVVMVPNEAASVEVLRSDLAGTTGAINDALCAGNLEAAYEVGAGAIIQHLGLDALRLIQEGTQTLARWRTR